MAHKVFWYDGMMRKDDALALDFLMKSADSELAGLSECFNNIDQDDGIRSEIKRSTSLEICCGSKRPIIAHASIARGESFKDPVSKPQTGYAWDAMYAAAKKAGKLTLLSAGTLTNIALTMLRYDDFGDYIEQVIFIAGTVGIGDSTPMSENKAALDVYAMKTLLTSGVRLLYIGTGSWNSDRVTPIEMVTCALEPAKYKVQKATMDIETVVCDQFARTILDTRVRNKAEKNIEFVFLNECKENLQ